MRSPFRGKTTPTAPLTGATILVVDDDEDIRLMVREALGKVGARVDDAADGIEALESMERERYDVIISDIRMPRCDGLELLKRVRAKPGAPGIIVMTGFFDVSVSDIMAAGGQEVLSKPFDGNDIVRAVEGFFRMIGKTFG